MATTRTIKLRVNGAEYEGNTEVRKTLVDFLREDLGLTGTNVGCEHGVCGACTILMNGETVRSCIMLAAQADGAELMTVEGLATIAASVNFRDASALTNSTSGCGFHRPHDISSIGEKSQASSPLEALGKKLMRPVFD